MTKKYTIHLSAKIFLLSFFTVAFSSVFAQKNLLTTTCDVYMNPAPLLRTTARNETNLLSGTGNIQGVAQQYNNLTGAIKSVVFWGRKNPLTPGTSNSVKVTIYQSNLGLPGAILGSGSATGTVIVSADTVASQYVVTFGSPVNVSNSNVIIAVEPASASNYDFFVVRNTAPNSAPFDLIKIKQSGNWNKDLAGGGADSSYYYDYLILPVKTGGTVSAAFTASNVGNTYTFTNGSSGAANYLWEFGDGDTSTVTSPVHTYGANGNYNVILIAYAPSPSPFDCKDTATNQMNVITTGINSNIKKNKLTLVNNPVQDKLLIESTEETQLSMYNVLGAFVGSYKTKLNEVLEINVSAYQKGMYFISSPGNKPVRFIKY